MPEGKIDPIGKYVAEYMSGYRCMVCNTVRDHHGHCDHERAEEFAEREFEIGRFLRARGADPDDRRSNLLFGASASALKRASLIAGNREAPHVGMTRHQAVMSEHRGRLQGKAMEWRPHQRPSGDELPL